MRDRARPPNFGKPIEAYDPIREIEPDLYCIDGDWQGSRFRRRMTILRTRAGELVIHNPIRLQDHDYAKIESLGLVAHIVAPNAFHNSDGGFYRARFPLAKFYPPGEVDRNWPAELRKEIEVHAVGGLRFVKETVFFHAVSRTLVVTDLVFHMRDPVEGAEKFFYRLNGIYQRFGPSRIFRTLFVADPNEVARSLDKILRWDFDRVIMNHGVILERDGPRKLLESFAEVGIRPRL